MSIMAKTLYGKFIGKENENGTISFKGIPYAKPPVGKLRWKRPLHPDPSDEVFEALEFGLSCVQPIDEIELSSIQPQGEDCLTLNIWTRELNVANKPVMVFIHGGGYIGGGANDPVYDGENFVNRHDIVFVSITYRCNVFGFMDLEEIGGTKYADSNNLGMLDQIQALEWIKENIGHFGGDADNITIFGESAGGSSVSLLMTIPEARGLFHKVIAQSGTFNFMKTVDMAKEITKDFVRITGTKTMEELQALNIDQLRDYCSKLMKEYGYGHELMFSPVTDGKLIPENPDESIRNGCASDVKLMIGTTLDELAYWKLYYDNLEDDEEMNDFLTQVCRVNGPDLSQPEKMINQYLSLEGPTNRMSLSNEILFRIPAIRFAEYQSKHAPTWMYLFTWQSGIEGLGACHAAEVPFVFYTLNSQSAIAFIGENPPKALADQVQDAWVAFAQNNNPSHSSIPHWPAYDDEKRITMIIDNEWRIEEDPYREERLALEKIYD
ncbi:para-nitrobenzyl esterase [Siminovitchia terrae]|uniref:Carboxylic ester hydrolase n=1 Tax=Siminovitchia terrae TaxID=1914933 RepID=A0ABQ4KRX5_SIMTE|nr:carboxylesterase/lipase family protein [Siminovitchia terrae]GIN94778.1 para-nitrobenzyl esterase [Siminovitchia terrae]